jgi:hypothetical protein
VKDIATAGGIDNWDIKGGLMPAVRACCVTEPGAMFAIGKHHSSSLIIP